MAASLWGKVYLNDAFAGELWQEAGGRCAFTYDRQYVESRRPAIAFTLPRRGAPYISENGLHPFFDNLVAEGWLRNAQARSLKVEPDNRFALLLAYGRDCAGAVSIVDPAPAAEPDIAFGDAAAVGALASRASLSGVQPKLFAVKEGATFRPARRNELSRYIAKLPSGALTDIVENEFIATEASRALLPRDEVARVAVAPLAGVRDRVLVVERFDRLSSGARVHFEEFNQLLGHRSGDEKYDARYDDMAAFIREAPRCAPADAWRLFQRLLVCILTGNTDAHLKNFAMIHTWDGLRLAPAYDLVAAALYPEYRTLALAIGAAADLVIEDVRPKHILALGEAHGLDPAQIAEAIGNLDARRGAAETATLAAARQVDAQSLGERLIDFMERRWNGTFASTGQFLSRKPSAGGEN